MELKVGDIIKNRYVLKFIMLDPKNNFAPCFFMYDKIKNYTYNYTEKEIKEMLEEK